MNWAEINGTIKHSPQVVNKVKSIMIVRTMQIVYSLVTPLVIIECHQLDLESCYCNNALVNDDSNADKL